MVRKYSQNIILDFPPSYSSVSDPQVMKNLFLNDLVFLLTNRFRLKKSLTEFSPDLFGTLNDNCFKIWGGGGHAFIANAIL